MHVRELPRIVLACLSQGSEEYMLCSKGRFVLPETGNALSQVGAEDPHDGNHKYRLELPAGTVVPFHRYPVSRVMFLAEGEATVWLCRNGILKKSVISHPKSVIAVPVGTHIALITGSVPAAFMIDSAGELNGNIEWEEPAFRLAENVHLDPKNKPPSD